jgi:hypothetical protein
MRQSGHVRWIAGAWTLLAAVGWAAEALMGWDNVWPLLVPAALVWRRLWSPLGRRRTRETTAAALRRYEDPGAELRAPTEAHAREALTRPQWQAWGLIAVLIGLAIACALVGWQRADGWDAAPATALLAVAIGVVAVDRISRERARRWLDDPPYAVVAARP